MFEHLNILSENESMIQVPGKGMFSSLTTIHSGPPLAEKSGMTATPAYTSDLARLIRMRQFSFIETNSLLIKLLLLLLLLSYVLTEQHTMSTHHGSGVLHLRLYTVLFSLQLLAQVSELAQHIMLSLGSSGRFYSA